MGALVTARSAAVSRKDLLASGDAGVRIHTREVRLDGQRTCDPIPLVHGARVPGTPSFDLAVPGGSLAADFAKKRFCVYVIDIRGYGESTRPAEMNQPAENHPPMVRTVEAVEDIDAAVNLIRKQSKSERVTIGIGGAVTRSPLPHHRTSGSAYGGSVN